MGKRFSWTWTALAGLAGAGLASGPLSAAPPDSLPADQLDWQPWGDARPAGELCRGRYVMPDYRLPPPPGEKVASESDNADYGEDGETLLGGEVLLRRGDAQLEAPRVRVPSSRETAYAEGPMTLRDRGLLVRGTSAEISLNSDAASIDTAHYVAHEQRLRGDAVRLARLEDGRYRLTEASFTTCEPGSDVWRLVGNDILLDRERGVGTAKHARLEVGKVPVFYWPWLRFPLDERRQTGFLWPLLGLS
uniref:LPS-assembly protein LptD n=1 Tax=Halomonas sp. TaxID=1486246 RepID=UPI0035625667